MLSKAESDYSAVQAMNQSALGAPELRVASDGINLANSAQRAGGSAEQVNHLAYLAVQKVAMAREAIATRVADASVATADASRDAMRLQSRTAEVDTAQLATAVAKQQTVQAMNATEESKRQTTQAQAATVIAQARVTDLDTQLRDLKATPSPRGMVVTLGDMLFDTNRAELKGGANRSLDQLVAFFKQNPSRKALIEGFTDNTGSDAMNRELSDRRASAVRSALVSRGIDGDRISTQGYGAAYPVASNSSGGSRQLNRRVEVVLSDELGVIPLR